MNKLLSLSLAVAAAASLAGFNHSSLAQAQLSGTPDELREFLHPRPNTVNINGEGELTAYKDIAKISLMVTSDERNLSQAMEVNQALRLDLIQEFVAAGIPVDAINNSNFSSSPQFGLFGRNPNSFEVSARMEIQVSSEEHLQLLAAAADEHDEVDFESIEFEHSEEGAFEDLAREMALQDVMAQKAYYESSLGLELKAINFFYGGIRQLSRAMPRAMMTQEIAMDTNSRGAVSAALTVAPTFDEVEYQTSINVVFEIVDEN
ncbi:MAG: SIMPL domain-containing protein [Gammaproteobacteria bacterium]|nr:SIMPL domain-containing protein [Gammaproteobacteria bacterium]